MDNEKYSSLTKLIGLVEKFPQLYDMGHPDYKNKTAKENAWTVISADMQTSFDGITAEGCANKWKNIQEKYNKENNEYITSGSGVKDIKEWPLINFLHFLKPYIYIKKRSTFGKVKVVNDETLESNHADTSIIDYSFNSDMDHSCVIELTNPEGEKDEPPRKKKKPTTDEDIFTETLNTINNLYKDKKNMDQNEKSICSFLDSCVNDLLLLTPANYRVFKLKAMNIIDDLLKEQENDLDL